MITHQDFENSKDLEDLMRRKNIVFATLRGTPAYWERMKSRIRHMIAMKGAPTAFATFSSADNFWPDIERCFESYVNNMTVILVRIGRVNYITDIERRIPQDRGLSTAGTRLGRPDRGIPHRKASLAMRMGRTNQFPQPPGQIRARSLLGVRRC